MIVWSVDDFYFFKILCNKSRQYFTEIKNVGDTNINDRRDILSRNLQGDFITKAAFWCRGCLYISPVVCGK